MNYFDILLAKKLEDDRDPRVEGLSVTENGRYHEDGVVYDPVIVALPLDSKTITENGTYHASDDNADGYSSVDVHVEGYKISEVSGLPSPIATFSDGANLPMPKLEVAIEPVQEGSGDPSPSNVRPISGWDEVNVSVCGVNVWDEEWEKGALSNVTGEPYLTSERIRSKNFTPTKPTTSYYFYAPNTYSNIRVACYDKDKNYLGQSRGWLNVSNNTSFMTPNNTYYIKFVVVKADETYNDDISINYPSTDTEYHAYNGQTYNIQFRDGDNPLTVYGGTLDVVSGVLTVDSTILDLGTIDWSKTIVGSYTVFNASSTIPGKKENVACSSYKAVVKARDALLDGEIGTWNTTNSLQPVIRDDSKVSMTGGEFKTAMDGVQLVYELATPTTIQLTPTAVSSLLGDNNLSADTGDVVEASYWEEL